MYLSGFEYFVPLERWCDFAKFWSGKKKTGGYYFQKNIIMRNFTPSPLIRVSFDPRKALFYILISAQNIEPPQWCGSNEYPQSIFEQK